MDSNLKIRVTSPSQSREEVKIARPAQASSDSDTDSTSTHGCQFSKRLEINRHFVGLTLGVVKVTENQDVFLYDPSLQETDLEQLEASALVVVDSDGHTCMLQSSNNNMHSDKFLQVCDACSSKAQSQVIPLLLPLLSKE